MKAKPTIIQVTAYYPPHLGGMENCAQYITNMLVKKGYPMHVYTSDIGVTKNSSSDQVSYLHSIEIAHTPIIFSLFYRLLKIPKHSIMHVHISQALTPEIVFLVSKLKKIPYVAHVHLDVDASGVFGFLLKPYKRFFLRPVLQHAAKVICLSEEQAQIIGTKYALPLSKLVIIPNGVGEAFFMEKIYNNKQTPQILFVGRLAMQKQVSRLLDALVLMKHAVNVAIVGEGEEKEKLIQITKEKNLKQVTFYGVKRGKELLSLYKNSDIFALPSDKEGISLSMLEAMAAGLPVVAFAVDGIREIIQDAGIAVNEKTPEAFAKMLDNLIENKTLYQRLSNQAKQKAKRYTWDKTIMEIERIYQEVAYDY